MNKILVTGGAGFIGSHLCPALIARGFKVRILDNLSPQIHGDVQQPPAWIADSGCEFQKGSVTSEQDIAIAIKGVDAIVHLAAETGTGQSMYQISRYNDVNSQGTAILLDAITNTDQHRVKRILLASSRAVYGEGAYVCNSCGDSGRYCPESRSAEQLALHQWEPLCPECKQPLVSVPTREDDQVNPASIYAATKYAQEDLVFITCRSLGIAFCIFRLQNVYGEGQSLNNPYTGILSIFSTRIRRGLSLPIFEDGEETRDFVHVEDVATAFCAALIAENGLDCVINVGTGVRTTVKDIATSLAEAFGKEPRLIVTGEYRLGDIRHNRADISRLSQILGCTPGIGLQQGLSRFADWVNSQPLPEDQLDRANAEMKAKKLMN